MIGLFGGTFDPAHNGHIRLAEQAISRLNLDEVQFLPCANPVHRPTPQVDSHHRLQMLGCALDGHSKMRINTLELDRGGPSYMVDTLREVLNKGEKNTLCLLIGVDAFNTLENWKSSHAILSMVHIVACRRPGAELNKDLFADAHVSSARDLGNQKSGLVFALDIEETPCSSTEVRALLASGQSVIHCLSESVIDYIKQNHLYGSKSEQY